MGQRQWKVVLHDYHVQHALTNLGLLSIIAVIIVASTLCCIFTADPMFTSMSVLSIILVGMSSNAALFFR